MGDVELILWGAVLGFVSAFPGQTILYRTQYWIAAREGLTMLRHVPYLRPVLAAAALIGALLAWGTGIVWSALLAGPGVGVLWAIPAVIAHALYRGRDHRLCEDHELPVAEALERELARQQRAKDEEVRFFR